MILNFIDLHYGFSDFFIFYFYGMTEHGNSFLKSITLSYELYSFLRYLILNLEKLSRPVTKYIKTTTFAKVFPYSLRSMLMSLQITQGTCCGQITDPQQ